MTEPITTLRYLSNELGFTVGEFAALPHIDKFYLRLWARDEMRLLGIPVKGD